MSSSSRRETRGRTRRTTLAAVAIAAVAVAGACGKDGEPAVSLGGSGVAAEVAGEKITVDSVQASVDRGLKLEGVQKTAEQLARETLTRRIRLVLFRREAERLGVTVSPEDLAKTRADLEQRMQESGGLAKAAASEGLGEPDLAEVVETITLDRLLSEKTLKDKPPTDAEVRAVYDEHKREIEQVEASHILVKDKALADKLLKDLQGGADFAELAKQHSTDSGSGAQGGALGPAPRGRYVPEFEEAVWSAEIGELVGPVKTEHGYHLIKVTKRPTFEDLKADIAEKGGPQIAHNRLLEAIKADAEAVKVNERYGRWDAKELTVVAPEGSTDDPSAPQTNGPGTGGPVPGPPQPGSPESPAPSP